MQSPCRPESVLLFFASKKILGSECGERSREEQERRPRREVSRPSGLDWIAVWRKSERDGKRCPEKDQARESRTVGIQQEKANEGSDLGGRTKTTRLRLTNEWLAVDL